MAHERMFHHSKSDKLDDPEREQFMPSGEIVARLGVRPGMHVADVGAGTGYFSRPIARAVGPTGTVLAVDVQREMLDKLRARLDASLPVKLVHGEATKTTLPDASVDLALLANVWHELDDRPATLAEMARILRPQGRIAILDWRPDVERVAGPPLDHRVALSAVRDELERHAWKVEEATHVGRFSYLVLGSRA